MLTQFGMARQSEVNPTVENECVLYNIAPSGVEAEEIDVAL